MSLLTGCFSSENVSLNLVNLFDIFQIKKDLDLGFCSFILFQSHSFLEWENNSEEVTHKMFSFENMIGFLIINNN